MEDYKWEPRTHFLDKEQVKDVVVTYAFSSERNLKMKKNDKKE